MSRYVDTLDSLPLYAGRAEADRKGHVIDVTYAPVSAVHDFTAGEHISVSGDVISVTGISELVPGDNITITASGVSAIISASGGGVTYNAGSGIDITNDTISLDDPVSLVAGSNISISVSGASAVISSTGGGGTLPISGVDGYYTAEYDVDHATLEYNLPSVGGGEPEHFTNEINPGSITISESYDGDVTDSHVYVSPGYIEFKDGTNIYTTIYPSDVSNWNDAIVASQIASAVVVQSLPANPVSNVLYLIPET